MMENTQIKQTCRICGEVKPLNRFEKDRRVKYEHDRTDRCLACKDKARNRAYIAFGRLKYRFPEDEIEVTKEEVDRLFDAFENRCAYCNTHQSEQPRRFHLEHIIPPKRGGRHHISNLVISCDPYNRKKGDRPIGWFYSHLPLEVRQTDRFILKYVSHFSGMSIEETEEFFRSDCEEYAHEKAIRHGQ